MGSNARTNPEGKRRDRIDDANALDPIERGRLAGSETSVRARWRVDTIPRDVESNAPPRETGTDLITLVQVRLTNPDPVEQRVSVRNALDGPVLFPRRRGVPEAGWGPNGFVGAVSAESERALGYACPASIRTPPIELDRAGESRRANGNQRTRETRQTSSGRQMSRDRQTNMRASDGTLSKNENGFSTTPAAVVRAHGDARPPAAVVRDGDRIAADESGQQVSNPASSGGRDDTGGDAKATERGSGHGSALPAALTAWLDDIERRIARAERLEDASVREATDVLSEADGLDSALDGIQLSEEAAELRTLAARAMDLADRADAVAVPEEGLRRLA